MDGGEAHGTQIAARLGLEANLLMRIHRVIIQQGERRLLVMVGRKRKQGKRHACGQLVQPKKVDRAQVAASMPHRKWLPARDKNKQPIPKEDRRAETVFGCLSLVGLINSLQFDAGERFQETVGRWRAVVDSPLEPQGFMAKITKSEHDPLESMPVVVRFKPMTDDEARRRWADYDGAFRAVRTLKDGITRASRHNLIVLNSVVIHNKTLQGGDLDFLHAALDRLVDYYGLTQGRKTA